MSTCFETRSSWTCKDAQTTSQVQRQRCIRQRTRLGQMYSDNSDARTQLSPQARGCQMPHAVAAQQPARWWNFVAAVALVDCCSGTWCSGVMVIRENTNWLDPVGILKSIKGIFHRSDPSQDLLWQPVWRNISVVTVVDKLICGVNQTPSAAPDPLSSYYTILEN